MSDSNKKFNVNKLSTDFVRDGKTGRQTANDARAIADAQGRDRLESQDAYEFALEDHTFGHQRKAEDFVFSKLVDGSDAKANAGFTISFMHVPSEQEVYFKAFLTTYNETFKPEWSQESVYGRADPIYMFKNTQRSITVGLVLPAATEGEGFENMGKLQQLIQFLYPSYTDADNALTISQSPLVRLKVMNVSTKMQSTGDAAGWGFSEYSTVFNTNNAQDGLLGVMQNLTINYNVDNPDFGSFEVAPGSIIPKAVEINFDFNVIHEHHLGWDVNGKFSSEFYPYDINLKGALQDAQNIATQYAMAEARKAREEAEAASKRADEIYKAEQERMDNAFVKFGNGVRKLFRPRRLGKKQIAAREAWFEATDDAMAAERRAETYEDNAGSYGSAADVYTDFID